LTRVFTVAVEQEFLIVVQGLNSPPTFNISRPELEVDEDSGRHEIQVAQDIQTDGMLGSSTEPDQDLTFLVNVTSGAHLFSVYPSISPQGLLSFRVADDEFGVATLMVGLQDSGGGSISLGRDVSYETQNITIFVSPVNDQPRFATEPEIFWTVTPAGYLSVPRFVSRITPGPANENCPYLSSTCQSQRVSFQILVRA
jgi:hypothetical protein